MRESKRIPRVHIAYSNSSFFLMVLTDHHWSPEHWNDAYMALEQSVLPVSIVHRWPD
jgi:hypothetical protein